MAGNTYDKRHYEDFAVGEVMEYGATEVTADAIIAFAREYDPEPYHTDPEAAKDTLLGGLCASGTQVGAWYRRMNFDAFPNMNSEASPGWDNIRWLKPVVPGDILSVRSTVTEMRVLESKPHLGMVKFDQEVLNQHGELKSTLSATVFYRRRDGAAAPSAA